MLTGGDWRTICSTDPRILTEYAWYDVTGVDVNLRSVNAMVGARSIAIRTRTNDLHTFLACIMPLQIAM